MQYLGPGRMFFLLVLVAGVAVVAALSNEGGHLFDAKYNDFLLNGARYTFEGSIAFGALYMYLPEKVGIEAFRRAWTEGLWKEGNDILARAQSAREALEALASVGSDSPDQLPVACTAEFGEVAAFCAGWRTRERRKYWHRALADQLQNATTALFDFLLTLELSSRPDTSALLSKKAAAEQRLDLVLRELQMTLKIPHP